MKKRLKVSVPALVLFALTVVILPRAAQAATLFDAVGPGSKGASVVNGTSLSWNHTVSGASTLLIVSVAVGNNNDTGLSLTATYNGVPMTSAAIVHSDNKNNGFEHLFYLVSPAGGTHAVNATLA